MEKNKLQDLLVILTTTGGEFQPAYISRCTGIPEETASQLLHRLSSEGYVTRCPTSTWSLSLHPRFEVTPKGRQEVNALSERVASMVRSPIEGGDLTE